MQELPMSAQPETRDEPQRETFDEVAARLFAQAESSDETDSPSDPTARDETRDREPGQPATAERDQPQPAEEPDDDDEALPVETRFQRSQRREQRVTAERERLAAEKAQAEQVASTWRGRHQAEQEARRHIEAERDTLKAQTDSNNAYLNTLWEDAIQRADPTDRADLQRQYDIDRREREVKAKEAAQELSSKQRDERARTVHQTQLSQVEQLTRRYAIGELVEELPERAAALGLERGDYADIEGYLRGPEVALLTATLPVRDPDPNKPDLDKYRRYQQARLEGELARRAEAKRAQRVERNRDEATGRFKPERALATAGSGGRETEEDVIARFRGTKDTFGMLEALNRARQE
jgi:hypothetical protein